ncbi:hypothetical protein [Pseudonocardia broussonetiae]|uniref:Uncharacterized protein n=1 Tax=Pseudonocardia broussonetiae TaxID=2736640 RepID=A0A6M6JBN9_9PSEU|nr:hypothetical protein [Pseudonocardia broussonetiae]QJY45358.1 hypothetical protein HOP40_05600 [Pseudonocardia broussonetiae]
MQLALTPEVLVPVGAGALLLVIALVAFLLVARRRRRARALAATVADPMVADPVVGTDAGADPDPGNGTGHDGAWSDPTERVGSGRTVAAAVAQALAAREAQARSGGSTPSEPATGLRAPAPDTAARNGAAHPAAAARNGTAHPAAPEPPAPDQGSRDAAPPRETVTPDVAPSARGDARDRLLAVLLDDPVRAVGATVELDACRRQLARLTDSVRHEREALRSVLARLADTGLGRDQLARLSGLSDAELRDLPDRVGVG